ncbi:MAG: hypothetical protein AAGG55_04780 [Pseudomonadota bacterium]
MYAKQTMVYCLATIEIQRSYTNEEFCYESHTFWCNIGVGDTPDVLIEQQHRLVLSQYGHQRAKTMIQKDEQVEKALPKQPNVVFAR